MCWSVPQIEAVFTRTSASVGPIAGTATVSICKPRAGCSFRNPFIVAAIYARFSRSTRKSTMLAHHVSPSATLSATPSFRAERELCAIPRGWRDEISCLFKCVASLHLLHHPNLLQRPQILHHHLQRHRPILCRHRITNPLRIPLPVREIQHFVGVLFPRSPQSLITQQLRRCHPRSFRVLRKIVIPKHRQRPLRPRFPCECQ